MTDKYLPIEDLADHLSVTVSTIRGWVKQGHIPSDCYIKVGAKTYRFEIPAVVDALKKGSEPKEEFTPTPTIFTTTDGYEFDDR